MLNECPHCFTDVLMKSDGTCPACLRDASNVSDQDLYMTKASLRHGTESPPNICAICGDATQRMGQFRRVAPQFTPSGLSIFGIARFLDRLSGKTAQEISLKVPECEACVSDGKRLRVHHLDFENAVATFIVHNRFKDALKSTR